MKPGAASRRVAQMLSGCSSRGALARDFLALRFQIDDDVRDRNVEALFGCADDVALEPVRAALRMRRDDDLVGAERAQRVLDRL